VGSKDGRGSLDSVSNHIFVNMHTNKQSGYLPPRTFTFRGADEVRVFIKPCMSCGDFGFDEEDRRDEVGFLVPDGPDGLEGPILLTILGSNPVPCRRLQSRPG
jgi:hypothetical protein